MMDHSAQDRENTDAIKDEKTGNSLKELLEGRIVADKFKRNGWFVLFVTVLGVWYISNGYSMEKLHRERNLLESEVRDLRFESITAAAPTSGMAPPYAASTASPMRCWKRLCWILRF